MKILAIDPATRCGWAHTCGVSGEWDMRGPADESEGTRLIKFRIRLEETIKRHGIDLVVHEKVVAFTGRPTGFLAVAEFVGVLKLFCAERHIRCMAYPPTRIKKHATGKGNAKKQDMVVAAQLHFGKPCGDNEADALWLLDLAKTERGLGSAKAIDAP